MILDKQEIDRIINQFTILKSALIDACSIIYMNKIGFLDLLCRYLTLYTIDEIIEETHYRGTSLTIIDHNHPPEAMTNDNKLFTCALTNKLSIISEDKKILIKAKKNNLPFFNTLMILHYVYYMDGITLEQHRHYRDKLIAIARYSKNIIAYADAVFNGIIRVKNHKI